MGLKVKGRNEPANIMYKYFEIIIKISTRGGSSIIIKIREGNIRSSVLKYTQYVLIEMTCNSDIFKFIIKNYL
jgi:hypothetical protein